MKRFSTASPADCRLFMSGMVRILWMNTSPRLSPIAVHPYRVSTLSALCSCCSRPCHPLSCLKSCGETLSIEPFQTSYSWTFDDNALSILLEGCPNLLNIDAMRHPIGANRLTGAVCPCEAYLETPRCQVIRIVLLD
jgi:hypothetical protein